MHQIFLRGLQLTTNNVALDQFGHFCTDHMSAQQLTCLRIKHRFDHALWLAQSNRFAVSDEGEATDLDVVPLLFRLSFGKADRGNLRVAIRAASNAFWFDRMRVFARDQFSYHNAFVAGLMRKPWGARNVADGVKTIDTCAAVFIRDNMRAVDFHA